MGATEIAPNTSFCPFAASRIRFAKLRLPLTPLRDFLLARCSKSFPETTRRRLVADFDRRSQSGRLAA
jgi:hypothetical protein